MADSFYITLPSNSIQETQFTNNTIANFRTQLAGSLTLSQDYEVALAEISYTKTWFTFRDSYFDIAFVVVPRRKTKSNENHVTATDVREFANDSPAIATEVNEFIEDHVTETEVTEYMKHGPVTEMHDLPPGWGIVPSKWTHVVSNKLAGPIKARRAAPTRKGRYEKSLPVGSSKPTYEGPMAFGHQIYVEGVFNEPSEFVFYLNDCIHKFDADSVHLQIPSLPIVDIDTRTNCVTITPGLTSTGDYFYPIFPQTLNDILGLPSNVSSATFYRGSKIIAEYPVDIIGSYHSLYVYSDIVESSFVGNSHTQLLRVVDVPSDKKFGQQVLLTYQQPHYVPLRVTNFNAIEIDIKDDTGERIPFKFGRTIVTLHFRKKL